MRAFTLGPWSVDPEEGDVGVVTAGSGETMEEICVASWPDAKLICEAPEMLRLLRAFYVEQRDRGYVGETGRLLEATRVVLARIDGDTEAS